MKYFAMYCPVEGEPKAGDVYQSKWRTELKFWYYVKVDEVTEQGGYKSDNGVYSKNDVIYKVELFICSTEVEIPKHPIPGFFSPERLEHTVIGKISDKAIWVEHGMVFEPSEIQLTTPWNHREDWKAVIRIAKDKNTGNVKQVRPYSPSFSGKRWIVIDPTIEDIVVEIKCPTCKTFH